MKEGKQLATLVGCLVLLTSVVATATAPSLISYQGTLADENGDITATGIKFFV